jgi:ABC-type multidrug transport system fused ATPase/permease subunit
MGIYGTFFKVYQNKIITVSNRKVLKNNSIIKKLHYLLTSQQKKQIFVLGMMLFFGTIFEMLGLGILLPIFGIMLNNNIIENHPFLKNIFELLGSPTQKQLIIGGMVFLIFIYLTKSIYLIVLGWKQNKFINELAISLSKQLYSGYLNQSYNFHLNKNSSFLIRNIHTDIIQFSTVCQSAIFISIEASLLIGVATLLLITEPIGAIFVTLFMAISAFSFQRLTKNKLISWGKEKQEFSGLVNKDLQQGFGGIKDVKIFGREQEFVNIFNNHNKSYFNTLKKIGTLNLVPRLYLELLAVAGLSGLIIFKVFQESSVELIIPTLGIFMASAFRMIPSVNRIMSSMQVVRFSKSVIDMIYEEFIMINENKCVLIVDSKSNILFNKEIKLENISFRYNGADKDSINKLTLFIKKGESVGLIGPSGSGKSTLVDLILGLHKPTKGNVFVDGINIQDNLRGWQNQIGYVSQSIYLLDDTIKKNIAFGIPETEINEDFISMALCDAQLEDFIYSLPDGINTLVGERGVRLSGGQRQRIGIARALYHNPEVLVLDEATSALDTRTEEKVMYAVNKLKGRKTIIMIAHRISTIKNCDTIYNVYNGEIK